MTDKTKISPAMTEALAMAAHHMRTEHVLFRDIPFETLSLDWGQVAFSMTPPASFADDEQIHGGLYTILLDTILAVAAWTKMEAFQPLATINLKTDFFASVPPGTAIECRAACEGIVDEVAFCHGSALGPDGTTLAQAAGTFMVGTASASNQGSRL